MSLKWLQNRLEKGFYLEEGGKTEVAVKLKLFPTLSLSLTLLSPNFPSPTLSVSFGQISFHSFFYPDCQKRSLHIIFHLVILSMWSDYLHVDNLVVNEICTFYSYFGKLAHFVLVLLFFVSPPPPPSPVCVRLLWQHFMARVLCTCFAYISSFSSPISPKLCSMYSILERGGRGKNCWKFADSAKWNIYSICNQWTKLKRINNTKLQIFSSKINIQSAIDEMCFERYLLLLSNSTYCMGRHL